MSMRVFACHKSREGGEVVCAGFLLRGADHNLAVRLSLSQGRLDPEAVSDDGHPLFPDYRSMAVFNGVDPGDRALAPCRGLEA